MEPPRGRGKGCPARQYSPYHRITPAQAGKSTCRASMPTVSWDHPRMGGEKLSCISLLGELLESPPQGGEKELDDRFKTAELGSPPRRRGKVGHNQIAGAAHGITPAWTGKRVHEYKSGRFARDHPRMGGEKAYRQTVPGLGLGSPPRRRGKAGAALRKERLSRITPAWARKRVLSLLISSLAWDHPRIGGEKASEYTRPLISLGSPPHRRGKDFDYAAIIAKSRITPAQAGKSHSTGQTIFDRKDHPRAGGEKTKKIP